MLSDSCEHVTQIGFGIQAVQPRCSYQTIKDRCAPSTRVRAGEQVVSAAYSNGPQRSLGDQVVQLDATVVEIARESIPKAERIVDGCGGLGLRRQLSQGLFQPSSQIVEQRAWPAMNEPRGVRRAVCP